MNSYLCIKYPASASPAFGESEHIDKNLHRPELIRDFPSYQEVCKVWLLSGKSFCSRRLDFD